MKQHAMLAGKPRCPLFWALFIEHYLGGHLQLAKEVWSRLYPSADLLYQLARIEDTGRRPEQIQRFAELLPPKLLLEACERLAPSQHGRPRRRDVVRLEEAILERTTRDGTSWV